MRSRASSTSTVLCAAIRVRAAARPATPAPMMTTSGSAAWAGVAKPAARLERKRRRPNVISPALYAIGLEMASSPQTWPALIATARGALWRAVDGTIERLAAAEVTGRAAGSLPLVCHAPAVAARLGLEDLRARDLLQLFAFVRPARFCLPTPRGLCQALDLGVPTMPEEEVACLPEAARALLDELEDMAALASPEMRDTALAMARGQWA